MMKKRITLGIVGIFVVSQPTTLWSHENEVNFSHRADAHAPIGVMGDHRHKEGEVMLSYRYHIMDMAGYRAGTSHRAPEDLFQQGYGVAPLKMTMEMHMFGLMYAPSNKVTLMGMLPYVEKRMTHQQNPMMGTAVFKTTTKGLGDIKIGALVGVLDEGGHRVHLNLGVSLPTGSIGERGDTLKPDQPLPYAMQIGSGTWDLLPGITYVGHNADISWGAQMMSTVHLGTNHQNYSWGDQYYATAWVARPVSQSLSLSLRLEYKNEQNIDGQDNQLGMMAPRIVPTADSKNSGGERLDIISGMNFLITNGRLKGHRIALEVALPIYQNLNGQQMETNFALLAGWQKAF